MKQFFAFFTPIWVMLLSAGIIFISLIQTQKGLQWYKQLNPYAETNIVMMIVIGLLIVVTLARTYQKAKAHRTRWNWEGLIDTHPLTD